jgi:peptidylprolyl isomerase
VSNDRRRQRRQQRQRQRRDRGPSYEPAGPVRFPGVFGWLQRQQRTFYAVGILVMIASLGAVFFGSQLGVHSGGSDPSSNDDPPAAEATSEDSSHDAEVSATETAEASETPAAAETPSDGDEDEAIVRVYEAPPPMEIDPAGTFEAVIQTEKGVVRVELFAAEAPGYVNNFVFLARNRFYDGLTFHRVVPGFVAQAGDPTATGFSGSGYALEEEFNDLPFEEGVISMAKGDGTVDGSQFFITLEPQPQLKDAGFTAFGRVIEGLDVLRALTARDPQQPGQPPGDRILSIEIRAGAG